MSRKRHQVAVLDVGCFSAHLVVAQQDTASLWRPIVSEKVRLRLDRAIDDSGRLDSSGVEQIIAAVRKVERRLRRVSVSAFVPFATSSVRDAANADRVIEQVNRRTGLELQFLSGAQEARLAYTAARHWFGPAAGLLTVLDVGGGTIELAVGDNGRPLFTRSLPLGARTLTRLGLQDGQRLAELSADVSDRIAEALSDKEVALAMQGRAVGCSKTFHQLARLAGKRTRHSGRVLSRQQLAKWIPRLAALPERRRAELRGISRHRARQSLAGAVVAEALMRATHQEVIEICPWSTKEGLLIDLLTNKHRTASDRAAA